MRKFEAFVGNTDEIMDDPTLVDLLTQIIKLRLDADKVRGEVGVFHKDVDEHMAEILNFRGAMKVILKGP